MTPAGPGERADTPTPPHHAPDGRFRNPWAGGNEGKRVLGDVLRWRVQRMRDGVPPDPPRGSFPIGTPHIAERLTDGERARVTWIGHSSFLVQLTDHNLLTDPVWSERVSPLSWAGPRRLTPPGIDFDALPEIHSVLLSHDHYDHLDEPTVRALHARFGNAITWITPLRYAPWLRRRGITNVVELDWWQHAEVGGPSHLLKVRAMPARHWTQRSMRDALQRLWCSFGVEDVRGTRVYFGGDSGYAPFYREIGAMEKPFDVVMLPVGAYDPRWFMEPAHMNPEDAVAAYQDLGAAGTFVPMHWGTFRLADDPPLEPPVRLAAAWEAAGLPADALWRPRHGDTLRLS